MNPYPKILLQLIAYFQKLPGVGKKTAERYAFSILKWSTQEHCALGNILNSIDTELSFCPDCNALKENLCPYCIPTRKQTGKLCLVSSMKDLYKIEQTKIFNGLYYILPNLLSPSNGYHADHFPLNSIKNHIEKNNITEITLVLDNTVEGDATTLYLREQLKNIPIYKLASGLPLGSPLEYIDQGTLQQALAEKKPV